MNEPIRLAIVGAGNRGRFSYGRWCRHRPDLARVVAVAEPDPVRRADMSEEHSIAPEREYSDWRELIGNLAGIDAVIIATLDDKHVEPAVDFLKAGMDILLEKPIAPTHAGIERVRAAARESRGTVTIGHVLRYTPMFGTLKRLIDDGAIGELRGINHAEHVGFRLFTHGYVRGNWRRKELSSPIILSKCCHDLDLMRWWAGARWTSVSSTGELTQFRSDRAPEGAPDYCLDGCPIESSCPFHAGRYYIDNNPDPDEHPISVITNDPSTEGRVAALRSGPYGRCVYRCDNDVPDHQESVFTFENGVRASFTMTAFAAEGARLTRLFGTRGDIVGDPRAGTITIHRYSPAPHFAVPSGARGGPKLTAGADTSQARSYVQTEIVEARPDPDVFPGHGGGDDGLMRAFVAHVRERSGQAREDADAGERGRARRRGDSPRSGRRGGRDAEEPTSALTSLDESFESHEMAFAAERSRLIENAVRPSDLRESLEETQ